DGAADRVAATVDEHHHRRARADAAARRPDVALAFVTVTITGIAIAVTNTGLAGLAGLGRLAGVAIRGCVAAPEQHDQRSDHRPTHAHFYSRNRNPFSTAHRPPPPA